MLVILLILLLSAARHKKKGDSLESIHECQCREQDKVHLATELTHNPWVKGL